MFVSCASDSVSFSNLFSEDETEDIMATEVVDQIEDTFLSCTICFQHFVKPKALPCLHTFCEGCIRDYVVARYEGVGQFPCPVCRQVGYT